MFLKRKITKGRIAFIKKRKPLPGILVDRFLFSDYIRDMHIPGYSICIKGELFYVRLFISDRYLYPPFVKEILEEFPPEEFPPKNRF